MYRAASSDIIFKVYKYTYAILVPPTPFLKYLIKNHTLVKVSQIIAQNDQCEIRKNLEKKIKKKNFRSGVEFQILGHFGSNFKFFAR